MHWVRYSIYTDYFVSTMLVCFLVINTWRDVPSCRRVILWHLPCLSDFVRSRIILRRRSSVRRVIISQMYCLFRCREYSKEMFPHADRLLDYLRDYRQKLGIKVQFNTDVRNIHSVGNSSAPDGVLHVFNDQHGNTYGCRYMVLIVVWITWFKYNLLTSTPRGVISES